MTPLPVPARFPRSAAYNPDWVASAISSGSHALWIAEWLSQAIDLQPGMRVLDLGCGRAASSIFLHREFGVRVWAADLWFDPSENLKRIRDAGAEGGVFPLRLDARNLPFAAEFFDAIVSHDSFMYYGTDDHFLNSLVRFLKPGGVLGIAGAGLTAEIDGPLPEHLRPWWEPEPGMWCLHSAAWWRRHWEKSGLVTVELADHMPDGWQLWLDYQRSICPDNKVELAAIEADAGRTITYVRAVARRKVDANPSAPVTAVATEYVAKPLLRPAGG